MKHRPWRKTKYQSTSLIAVVLLLLILFVIAGYFFSLTEEEVVASNPELAELQEQRALWEEKRPAEFRFVVERQCECPEDYTRPFTVTENYDALDEAPWMDDFFDRIEVALQSDSYISIAYDPRFSYPNDVTLGRERILIRDFEVIRYRHES